MAYFARIICNKENQFTRQFDTKEELAEGLKEFFIDEIAVVILLAVSKAHMKSPMARTKI